jgi:polyhydroxybutyrate depolymerase
MKTPSTNSPIAARVLKRFASIGFAALAAVACGGSPPRAERQDGGQGAPAVAVSPASVELASGATQRFSASVSGAADTSLVWSVDEPAGGAVDGAGAYTAPAADGTYHVRVSLRSSPAASAAATVNVTAPQLTIKYVSERRRMVSSGDNREFILARPDPMPAGASLPLVFSFHWDGGTGDAMRGALPLEAQAAHGAVFVYPDALLGGTFEYWNDQGRAREETLVRDLIAALAAELHIDPARVFLAGMSGGATLANALGCRLGPGVVRAVAIHSGTLWPVNAGGGQDFYVQQSGGVSCALPAAILMWGKNDNSGDTSFANGEGTRNLYVATQACAAANPPAWSVSPCVAYAGCARPVVWCAVDGLGHEIWSGAAAAIWKFFETY